MTSIFWDKPDSNSDSILGCTGHLWLPPQLPSSHPYICEHGCALVCEHGCALVFPVIPSLWHTGESVSPHSSVCSLAGFREGYPYPHPHTLYFLEKANLRPHRFLPEQLRAKMLLFAFANALAQARFLHGVCVWRRAWGWPSAVKTTSRKLGMGD